MKPADLLALLQDVYRDKLALYDRHTRGAQRVAGYEFNNTYRAAFEKDSFVFSGTSPDGQLVEVIELKNHPFYIACQFHPEFQSKPSKPHPLFKGFIAASHNYAHRRAV